MRSLALPLLLFLALPLSGCVTPRPERADAAIIVPPPLPKYGKTVVVRSPIRVEPGQVLDGALPGGLVTRYVAHGSLGDGSQREGQQPLFILRGGATLKNARLGTPAADGIHIQPAAGSTTRVRNVHFEDVGEDAVTVLNGAAGAVNGHAVEIVESSFRRAADKCIQVNGPSRVTVSGCYAERFGRFARGCGTCGEALAYRITVRDLAARDGDAVLRLTTPRGRGWVEGGRYERVGKIAEAENGAVIVVR